MLAVCINILILGWYSALQCPTWGYPTEGAYYRDATSTDAMLNIRIPFLCVQAEDDPVSGFYL